KAFENQWKLGATGSAGTWTGGVSYVGIEDGATKSTTTGFSGYDQYDGGSGGTKGNLTDTLQIWLNADQIADPAIIAEIAYAQAWVQQQMNGGSGQAGTATYTFKTINLTITQLEKIEVRNFNGYLDLTADADNNFAVTVAASDKVTNNVEKTDVSLTLSGVDSDAVSVAVSIDDGDASTAPVTATATKIGGVWTLADVNLASLKDGLVTVTATVTDGAGNTKQVTDTLTLDTTADADNNFAVTVAASDKVTNNVEKTSVSLTLSGVDSDAVSVAVSIDDGDASTAPVTATATKVGGVWTLADVNLASLKDGLVTVTATVTDAAGNTKQATDTLTVDTTADADNNFAVTVAAGDK